MSDSRNIFVGILLTKGMAQLVKNMILLTRSYISDGQTIEVARNPVFATQEQTKGTQNRKFSAAWINFFQAQEQKVLQKVRYNKVYGVRYTIIINSITSLKKCVVSIKRLLLKYCNKNKN